MGYVRYIDGRQEYEEHRFIMRGGYALLCYECNRHTDRWVAAELPSAAEDMHRAKELYGRGGHNFYIFHHDYQISFPDCGHQDVRGQWDVWRFYMCASEPKMLPTIQSVGEYTFYFQIQGSSSSG